jgi:hypothetical protein
MGAGSATGSGSSACSGTGSNICMGVGSGTGSSSCMGSGSGAGSGTCMDSGSGACMGSTSVWLLPDRPVSARDLFSGLILITNDLIYSSSSSRPQREPERELRELDRESQSLLPRWRLPLCSG